MEFSNREIAFLIWLTVGVAAGAMKKDIRSAFGGVFRAFLVPKILLSLTIATLWVGACVWLLAISAVWTWSNLKTTLVWSITFAFVTVLDVSRISEDDTYFGKTVRDVIGATAIVTFVAEAYSFGLGAELVLLPVLTFVGLMYELAKREPKYKSVERLCVAVLATAGISYVGHGLLGIAGDFKNFVTWGTLRDFGIPILLSLLFLPFMYVFGALVVYETKFVALDYFIPDAPLRRYAKWRSVLGFRFDLDLLRRWMRDIGRIRPIARAEIDSSIRDVKARKVKEVNPSPVPSEVGWSPPAATKFLEPLGLHTGDYHSTYDDEWWAGSRLVEIEESGLLPDNIAYYVAGNEEAATCLKLKLNVNNPDNASASEAKFVEACELLIHAATSGNIPTSLQDRLRRLEPIDETVGERRIAVEREDNLRGYTRIFSVARRSESDSGSGHAG